ncbi:MAG TPA: phosphoribosylformylglycinamidine cyclo-ligase [Abditibacteriaceae bacterium]|nr:phosphoribosylformylglycinamidine cyclo-ligase [Abditibacteriaceae bacterium]
MSESNNHAADNGLAVATYADAGVNIEAGNETVRRIKPHAQRTFIPGVLGGVGGFGALFQHDFAQYQEPILVSSTDGVGTKLKLAFALNRHDTVGIDLVAMCANDVLCCGARPLFFLDYFGTGKLSPEVAEAVVKGIADGCVQAGCALIGGETAELPGFYSSGEYDLAGFCVGVVDKSRMIDGSTIRPGDAVLGLSSTGLHSNGYSLARKVLEPLGYATFHEDLGTTVGAAMLTPTQIYVRPVLELMEAIAIKGLAHITGGGFYENIPRMLPHGTMAVIERGSWPVSPIFRLIQQNATVAESEMFRTFNMGIGMVVVVDEKDAATARERLAEYSIPAHQIGVIAATDEAPHILLR